MRYLIDTDWVADYLTGRPPAVALLTSLLPDGLAISIITFGEIYEGVYYGSAPKHHEAVFRRFLRGITVLGINRAVARRFALIRGDLRARGMLIGQPDLLIAATALHHQLVLVTRNGHCCQIRLGGSDAAGEVPALYSALPLPPE